MNLKLFWNFSVQYDVKNHWKHENYFDEKFHHISHGEAWATPVLSFEFWAFNTRSHKMFLTALLWKCKHNFMLYVTSDILTFLCAKSSPFGQLWKRKGNHKGNQRNENKTKSFWKSNAVIKFIWKNVLLFELLCLVLLFSHIFFILGIIV